MENTPRIQYFLGSNSAQGFYSLYNEFVNPEEGDFLWVLKGGPGCGKSTFMSRIAAAAEEAGLQVERVLCSGDPDSLDGIYIPSLRTAYVDGTAPHAQEPLYPGAGGAYLDLSSFYDQSRLREKIGILPDMTRRYKEQYRRAYTLLKAAELVSPEKLPGLRSRQTEAAVRKRAVSFAGRLLPEGEGYRERKYFLSAISCIGPRILWKTAEALCPRICLLDNELGLAPVFLDELRRACAGRSQPVIACPSPLQPAELENLLIPGAGVAFLTDKKGITPPEKVFRHIRLDAMADIEAVRSCRTEFRRAVRVREELMNQAYASLRRARELHDGLEEEYHSFVDFGAQTDLCEQHIRSLLG